MSHPEQCGERFLKLQLVGFGGNQLSAGICGISRERHVEYFPLDFKVSPVCARLHSSLLNTSSELPPLPSALRLVFFAVFNCLHALPPFSLPGQGSGSFSNENSCLHAESIFAVH